MNTNNYYSQRNIDYVNRLEKIKQDLPDFCQDFFVGLQHHTAILTRVNYAYDLRIFFDYLYKKGKVKNPKDFALVELENINAFDIEQFLDYLTYYTYNGKQSQCKAHAKERKLSAVRALTKYFFKKDLLEKDTASKVSSVKIKEGTIVRLDVEEVANLLDLVEHGSDKFSKRQQTYLKQTKIRDLAILTLFLGTGIRVSELVGMDIEDVNFKDNSFRIIRKGGNASILYFNDEVGKTLIEYTNFRMLQLQNNPSNTSQNALFLTTKGNRLCVRSVQLLVKKFTKQINTLKKISPHKLRSTFGTQLYRDTQDIYVVAEVLGHKDVNTTKKHYAQTNEDIKRNAANTVKLRK
ncbi:MAG: tyrosine-type recombinase/integrase [Firmicutes bacterium]|nr:tyrosine-type recombinase/integrase [Bacillota bacterium]MCL1954068.1 tyrosine-type recombinase/integrase [Bacillota bacterium]